MQLEILVCPKQFEICPKLSLLWFTLINYINCFDIGREGESETKRKKREAEENIPLSERLQNAVTPLWNTPYEQQLKVYLTILCNLQQNLFIADCLAFHICVTA